LPTGARKLATIVRRSASGERVTHRSERVGHKREEKVAHGSERVGHSSERVTHSSERLTNRSERVGHWSERVGHRSERVTHRSERVGHRSEWVTHRSERAIITLYILSLNILRVKCRVINRKKVEIVNVFVLGRFHVQTYFEQARANIHKKHCQPRTNTLRSGKAIAVIYVATGKASYKTVSQDDNCFVGLRIVGINHYPLVVLKNVNWSMPFHVNKIFCPHRGFLMSIRKVAILYTLTSPNSDTSFSSPGSNPSKKDLHASAPIGCATICSRELLSSSVVAFLSVNFPDPIVAAISISALYMAVSPLLEARAVNPVS
jgi:hypothetical protein